MSNIQDEGQHQEILFPVLLDDLPGDHVCRVMDVFVNGLKMAALGFEPAEAAETGRPASRIVKSMMLFTSIPPLEAAIQI